MNEIRISHSQTSISTGSDPEYLGGRAQFLFDDDGDLQFLHDFSRAYNVDIGRR